MAMLNELFDQVWTYIEADGDGTLRPEAVGSEHTDPGDRYDSPIDQYAVSRYLRPSLQSAHHCVKPIVELIDQQVNALTWSQNASYTEQKLGRRFMGNYVTGILTGPEANLARHIPCSGFVLLGPETEYPSHSHVPREVYLVLTPGGEWRLDDGDWFSVESGQVIYHAKLQNHAMRTRNAPMLAFAAWLDDGDRDAITI